MLTPMGRLSELAAERRTGLLSLALAVAVAFVAWFAWWIWRAAPAHNDERPLARVTVSWKCARGHVYEAPAAIGPQPCPQCGADAYVVQRYRCPEHGEFDVLLRHERNREGRVVVVAVRFEEGPWVEHPSAIRCPTCGRKMRPARSEVFSRQSKEKGE